MRIDPLVKKLLRKVPEWLGKKIAKDRLAEVAAALCAAHFCEEGRKEVDLSQTYSYCRDLSKEYAVLFVDHSGRTDLALLACGGTCASLTASEDYRTNCLGSNCGGD